MLRFTGFSKSFQTRTILDFGDLELPGGVSWLLGENGAGKSTLMYCAAGIQPFKGEISIKGARLKKESIAYRLHVNMAEAEPVFPAFLKGMELIRFFEESKKAPAGQSEVLIERFQVRHFIYEPVGTYSSGMTKKLSLILAFLGKPALILLDEPLITLDVQAQEILHHLILETAALSVNFLISSHQELDLGNQLPINRLRLDQGKLLINT
ncbi:ABC-2 type transport system ATP-binding protein [bacterium A37T11]|nr:ABC-2 type transport system ATP-binding protein [bacterium A37T11]